MFYLQAVNLGIEEYDSTCQANMHEMTSQQKSQAFSSADDMVVTKKADGNPDFEWDDTIQGYLLSAYGFGFILGNLSGGTFCALFGGKKYMAVTMTLTAVLQLVSPVAATQSHWLLFCSRLLFGACVSADKTFY